MLENTPPKKLLNPENSDNDFINSDTSSYVYRPAQKIPPKQESPSKRLMQLISKIAKCLTRLKILLFDPVSF